MVLNQCSLGPQKAGIWPQAPHPSSFSWELYCPLEHNPTPSVYLNHLLQLSINKQHPSSRQLCKGFEAPLFPLPHHPPLKSSIMDSCAFCIPGPSLISFLPQPSPPPCLALAFLVFMGPPQLPCSPLPVQPLLNTLSSSPLCPQDGAQAY